MSVGTQLYETFMQARGDPGAVTALVDRINADEFTPKELEGLFKRNSFNIDDARVLTAALDHVRQGVDLHSSAFKMVMMGRTFSADVIKELGDHINSSLVNQNLGTFAATIENESYKDPLKSLLRIDRSLEDMAKFYPAGKTEMFAQAAQTKAPLLAQNELAVRYYTDSLIAERPEQALPHLPHLLKEGIISQEQAQNVILNSGYNPEIFVENPALFKVFLEDKALKEITVEEFKELSMEELTGDPDLLRAIRHNSELAVELRAHPEYRDTMRDPHLSRRLNLTDPKTNLSEGYVLYPTPDKNDWGADAENPTDLMSRFMPGFSLAHTYMDLVPIQEGRPTGLVVNLEPVIKMGASHSYITSSMMDLVLKAMPDTSVHQLRVAPYMDNPETFLHYGDPLMEIEPAVIHTSSGAGGDYYHENIPLNTQTVFSSTAGNDAEDLKNVYTGVDGKKYVSQNIGAIRHTSAPNSVQFGSAYVENGRYIATDHTNPDGETTVLVPMPDPKAKIFSKDWADEETCERYTSFAGPMGASFMADALTRFPELQPHQVIWAMAHSARPVIEQEGSDQSISYVATPDGLAYSNKAGFGAFRPDDFYSRLVEMREELKANPDVNLTPQALWENSKHSFPDGLTSTADGRQKAIINVETSGTAIRPVFTLHFDQDAVKLDFPDQRFWPLRITSPEGTSFDYVLDVDAATRGKASISGTGFMGAESKGQWMIESLDPNFDLSISSIETHMAMSTGQDLIHNPKFRTTYTTDLEGQDLSRFSDVYIQNGGNDEQGGWLSKAAQEGWADHLNLKGVKLHPDLQDGLSSKIISEFRRSSEGGSETQFISRSEPQDLIAADTVEIHLNSLG